MLRSIPLLPTSSSWPVYQPFTKCTPLGHDGRRVSHVERSVVVWFVGFVGVVVGPAVVVRLGAGDLVVLVEIDLDLGAVGLADLDAIGGAVVAHLGVGDLTLADVGLGGRDRFVPGNAFELGVVVGVGRQHGAGPADHDGDG